jgi:hypothetical protein
MTLETILPEIRKGRRARRKGWVYRWLDESYALFNTEDLLADDWELEPDAVKDLCDILREGKIQVRFGLEAQGHIPTIEKALAEGKTWEEIGKLIGWCPVTAKKHFERLTE